MCDVKCEATRPYRMTARRASVEATRERICAATVELWLGSSYDQMTLDEVARRAGVTRQTVLRHYANKEALLLAATDWYAPRLEAASRVEPGDVEGAIEAIVGQYETMGDANVRMLEMEDRIEAFRVGLERGRAQHRSWVEQSFGPWVDAVPATERDLLVDALYTATDVMVWKLLRRDLGRSVGVTRDVMGRLVTGALRSAGEKGAAQ